MGVPPQALAMLANIIKQCNLPTRSVLQLGKQDTSVSMSQLMTIGTQFGFLPEGTTAETLPPDHLLSRLIASGKQWSTYPGEREVGHVNDLAIFAMLGFTMNRSTDINDFEGADVLFDLNNPGLQEAVGEKVDMVYDGGTIEHCFHIPNCMQNIFDVLNVGGAVVHVSPTNNYVDHGFFQFSPTFFWDFYKENEWEICEALLVEHDKTDMSHWKMYDYTGLGSANWTWGSLGARYYVTSFVARKTERSTGHRVPQQGMFKWAWEAQRRDPAGAIL